MTPDEQQALLGAGEQVVTYDRGDLRAALTDDGGYIVGRPYEGLVLSPDELRWLVLNVGPALLVEGDRRADV